MVSKKVPKWDRAEHDKFKAIIRAGGADNAEVRAKLLAAMQETRPLSTVKAVTRYCSRYARHLLEFEKGKKRRRALVTSEPVEPANEVPVRIGKWTGFVSKATAKAMIELLVEV